MSKKSIEITLLQAEALVAFFGGHDCEVTVTERPDGPEWKNAPEGLYAYYTEYPEHGAAYLGPTEVNDELAVHGKPRLDDLLLMALEAMVRKWDEHHPVQSCTCDDTDDQSPMKVCEICLARGAISAARDR